MGIVLLFLKSFAIILAISILTAMEKKLREICQFIIDISALESTITQNKLSLAEVAALFKLVDVKGKGFLDLNDIFELVGKVSEEELFVVFKFMDRERTGEIRLKQMEECLGNPTLTSNNTSKEHIFPKFYTIVDTVKDKPKLISSTKTKLNLSSSDLKAIFEYICGLVQSKYISHQELSTVLKAQAMKYGLKWGQEQEKLLCEMIPGQNVNESKFIECFGSNQKKEEIDQEDLLEGIACIEKGNTPKKQQIPTKSPKRSSFPAEPSQIPKVSPHSSSQSPIPKKPVPSPTFETPVDPPSFRYNNFTSPKPQESSPPEYKKQFAEMQTNITGVLDAIQQRRERLRQDSLERKKLIDDVMNRKRELGGLTQPRGLSSPKEGSWKNEEIDPRSYLNLLKSKERERQKVNYQVNASSPKQFAYTLYNQEPKRVEEESYTQYRESKERYLTGGQLKDQPRDNQILSSEYKYKARPQTPQGRPQTPLSSVSTDINQILKKYSNSNIQEPFRADNNQSTLKQLCKSKSGFLYSQPGYSSYTSKFTSQITQNFNNRHPDREETLFNSKYRAASKENVMKRAEEQAAKKIQEIERKARMKVLERKNLAKGDRDVREWRPLTKKGTYY